MMALLSGDNMSPALATDLAGDWICALNVLACYKSVCEA
jgi:hypothetical protein